MHFVRLASALQNDEESARDNHVLVCNFVKYSPILKFWKSVKIWQNYDHKVVGSLFCSPFIVVGG